MMIEEDIINKLKIGDLKSLRLKMNSRNFYFHTDFNALFTTLFSQFFFHRNIVTKNDFYHWINIFEDLIKNKQLFLKYYIHFAIIHRKTGELQEHLEEYDGEKIFFDNRIKYTPSDVDWATKNILPLINNYN